MKEIHTWSQSCFQNHAPVQLVSREVRYVTKNIYQFCYNEDESEMEEDASAKGDAESKAVYKLLLVLWRFWNLTTVLGTQKSRI